MAFRKIGKHYQCLEGKKCACSLTLSVCGKWYFLCNHCKITKHHKKRGFSMHGGKPKMAILATTMPFWEGASKGGFTISDAQKLFSAEDTFYCAFSKHGFAEIKECKLKKTEIYKKYGVVCQHARRCFFLGGVVLFCLCVFTLCSVKMAQKGYFPATLQKACV